MKYNIVFVGSVEAGKTSLIQKKLYDRSDQTYASTLSVDYAPWVVDDIEMSIWDTCGQERFLAITSSYYMRGHVFVLVHDTTKDDIGKHLEMWRKEIVAKKPPRHSPVIIVVSNKMDLAPCSSKVSDWVRQYEYDHIKTSVVTGRGVDALFEKIKDAVIVHQSDWLSPSLPALPDSTPQASPGCAC